MSDEREPLPALPDGLVWFHDDPRITVDENNFLVFDFTKPSPAEENPS